MLRWLSALASLAVAASLEHTYYEHVPLNTTDAAGVVVKDKVMIFLGGSPDRADAMFFDIDSKRWSVQTGVLSHPGTKPVVGVASPDGALALFAGGQGPNKTNYDDVDVYNATSDTWLRLRLSIPRSFLAAASVEAPAAMGGSLLFFGGGEYTEGVSGFDSSRVDIFWQRPDGGLELWNSSDALSKPRKKLAAAAAGRYVLFAGGYTSGEKNTTKRGYCDDVDVYDVEAGTWSTATLSQPRQYITGAGVGDAAVFAGGFCSPCTGQPGTSRSDVVDIFDAASGSFTSAELSQRRSNLAMTSVGGRFAIIGGGTTDVDGESLGISRSDVVDIYDAATQTWSIEKFGSGRCCLGAAGSGDTAAFCGGTIGDACDVFTFDGKRTWIA